MSARTDTTVADAYLSPVLDAYVARVARRVRSKRDTAARSCSRMAASAHAKTFRGRDAVLSGPAGGVVAWRRRRSAPGSTRCSASTWAARRPTSRTMPARSSGPTTRWWRACASPTPMLQIHTVAAGGGSICFFDGARLRVGPHSAGRRSGASLLPARRTAHDHRLQRAARARAAGVLPGDLRAAGR